MQYILQDQDISHNINLENNKFIDGAIAATLSTLDQGTHEIFAFGVGKKSGGYNTILLKYLLLLVL